MNTVRHVAKNTGILPVSCIASYISGFLFVMYTARYLGAEVIYKVDNVCAPSHESGLIWNDPDVNIQWPIESPIISEKDKKLPSLEELIKRR